MSQHKHKQVGVLAVAALGVGSMIGAGIFALLGQIALLGPLSYLSFIITGILALLSGYSYAKIAAVYPNEGGVVDFFSLGAIKNKTLIRVLGVLYLYTFIIATAVICQSFGLYMAEILGQPVFMAHVYQSAITVILAIVALSSSKTIGGIELFLSGTKILIIAFFIVVVAITINPSKISTTIPHGAAGSFVSSLVLAYFAYAGYDVIANTGKDLKNVKKSMPRAFFLAIGCVVLVYMLLDLVVVNNLTHAQLVQHSQVALAYAAKPILGNSGRILISIAALFATSSAILAMIYSIVHSSKYMGKKGDLPKIWKTPFMFQTQGYWLWIVVCLIMENFMSLNAIANVTGIDYLIIYSVVFFVAIRLRKSINANYSLLMIGFVGMIIILVLFTAGLFIGQNWVQLGLLAVVLLSSVALAWKQWSPNELENNTKNPSIEDKK